LRNRIHAYRARKNWDEVLNNWAQAAAQGKAATLSQKRGRILIFPSDLDAITGALGDDAMITATVDMFRTVHPDLAVDMFCSAGASEIVRAKGFTPVILPPMKDFPQAMADRFKGAPYDAMIALGADIMDGYYSVTSTARILIAADLAVRNGIPATILGCSFNDKPAPALAAVYGRLDKRVDLNMRDEISFDRVRAFAPVTPRLVADSAFTLAPGHADPEAVAWVEAQRAAQRSVVGVNVHPMLIKGATEADVEKIVAASVTALRDVSGRQPVSWLMLPHDYRGSDGDATCLRPIFDRLKAAGLTNLHYLDGEHRAADLKAVAGHLDGVITGRMHLAIAALGKGVPVLSLTYQDKFEGLYRHFGLPRSLLLPPAIFDTPDALASNMEDFVTALPDLTGIVAEAKPKVLDLARENYTRYTAQETV
tara:strand:+ start:574 stop:1845 length:1272 start_codon:yes stop_codon:yes gene_type:complete